MSNISGTSSEIEDDEQIDVAVDEAPIDTGCHRRHHHQQQQQHRCHGHQLQQPICSTQQLRPSHAAEPRSRFNHPATEPDDLVRKRSGQKESIRSTSDLESLPSKYVSCSTNVELRSLLSMTAEDEPRNTSAVGKRFFRSPRSSFTDRSLSSGASSSVSPSSSSSSAGSSPPSSPSHKKKKPQLRPSTVPSSINTPFPLSLTVSDASHQQHRRPPCPSNASSPAAASTVAPRSAPTPVTNFLIEEILKPSFGVSSKSSIQPTVDCRSTYNNWGRSCDQRLGLSPDLLKLPIRTELPFNNQKCEHSPISTRVNVQEETSDQNHVTRKRKQSRPSENRIGVDHSHRKVDLEKGDRRSSSRVIEDRNVSSIGVSSTRVQSSPTRKSSPRRQAPQLAQTENCAFKLVVTTCTSSSTNDCSNSSSSSSSNVSSHPSHPDDNRKSEESDQQQHLHLSDPSSASSGSPSCLQSQQQQLPAWVFCTRYSDRPSSGPRSRKVRPRAADTVDDKRPRTAFTNDQLQILKREFAANQYLNEDRRHALAAKLNLNETQIKIWFQNKRAKLKKASGTRNRLALELMAQGLYNHSTVTATGDCG